MGWRLAKSLVTLRDQLNNVYPNRSKASDGTIGDSSHAASSSDHNPNAQGVVCAFDITHDPANGFDAGKFVEIQRANPHPNLKYMIFNGRIYSRIYGWTSRPSSGHYKHVHVSVGVGRDGKSVQPYDDTIAWNINSQPIQQESAGVKVKATDIEYVTVKVQTGSNGAGYKDIQLSKDGLTVVGHGWVGSSSKGLACAVQSLGGSKYRIGVEGAPGAFEISVNVSFA